MITVKLFPTLRDYRPSGAPPREAFTLDLAEWPGKVVRINDVITFLKIPSNKVHIAIVNGKIVRDFDVIVKDGDLLFLSPMIAGG
jgi:hypothetical protein